MAHHDEPRLLPAARLSRRVVCEGAGLGQLVVTSNGTIVVTRFGNGTAGDVAYVTPAGDAQVVPGLDPERRRIGLTITDDGGLFDAWFVRLASGDRAGAVGELSLGGTETERITGLKKPIGVLAVGANLFVSDQDLGQILKAPLSDPAPYTVHAAVESPDLSTSSPPPPLATSRDTMSRPSKSRPGAGRGAS